MPKPRATKAAPKAKPALRAPKMKATNPVVNKAVAARKGAKKK